MALQH